ncbi:FHA domain-containing protein [Leptolyngbya sp. CCY15150]|uniref:FHA domain-containing protein n=1 Tax=Leptolyngbya sp. CCY15150 TaxID=2767772 RepID=UPI00194ED446|nr:FHA domain-containing protein [Leptolyngbya sp. CCY15150]
MIVCPNCNHQNPDGAVQCEACYTPLPEMASCPSCGASVQADASFCGQCGFDLRGGTAPVNESAAIPPTITPGLGLPDSPSTPDEMSFSPVNLEPLVEPEPLVEGLGIAESSPAMTPDSEEMPAPTPAPAPMEATAPSPSPAAASPAIGSTQLQLQTARLFHVQTNTTLELPPGLTVVHIGKPNDRVPPDIDVAGFPNSEIVSRIHADIRIEGDVHYIEDVGSSNGTYINNTPLPAGNRHRLRPGDRIALGKGDQVTFLFQMA